MERKQIPSKERVVPSDAAGPKTWSLQTGLRSVALSSTPWPTLGIILAEILTLKFDSWVDAQPRLSPFEAESGL